MILTPSIRRVVANVRQVGLRQAWRDLNYIGDMKAGRYCGQDEHGNRFFENPDETLWRHRWVDFASHDFNASQVTPEWHAWLTHIRHLPPPEDPIMQASKQPWQTPHFENLTGTRGAFKTYSTTKPKIAGWEPKVAARA
ncbi:NADH ubiquinone oxidoreductase subunit NDUFA12-domain-containing protein [Leucosporidium creatinivorum]|uniref:NADH dehydrogenase [ubiquinone] 1 alpha subcomplex subunit n=1 Tax=Leucosporidium creatinivorum TaxID=106004 RepID=A0A1Y2FZD0_9BASI|nr:NADH ubiquinone oxidoreductase subunit NDUFA12-domain-containing protein [Leucosporidium creatinivorum]